LTYHADEPPEPTARPFAGRASLNAELVSAEDPAWQVELASWLAAIPALERRVALTPLTRRKLEDSRRICGELLRVLRGAEEGEGRKSERSLLAVRALGRVQALSSMFACPGGTFIELVATAPWNLLGRGDPSDPRTVHGAGTALVERAIAWSRRRGCRGRVALQAGSRCSMGFYERLGFRLLEPTDHPLTLVPQGEHGWSPEVLRVAKGTPGPDEERSPWLVVEPDGRKPANRKPGALEPGAQAAASQSIPPPAGVASRQRISPAA
jgi:GNAT superfamily N-acetyltransferase